MSDTVLSSVSHNCWTRGQVDAQLPERTHDDAGHHAEGIQLRIAERLVSHGRHAQCFQSDILQSSFYNEAFTHKSIVLSNPCEDEGRVPSKIWKGFVPT